MMRRKTSFVMQNEKWFGTLKESVDFLKKWTRYRKSKKTQFPLTPGWLLLSTISFKEKNWPKK